MCYIKPIKKDSCVQVSRPTLLFFPDPKFFQAFGSSSTMIYYKNEILV